MSNPSSYRKNKIERLRDKEFRSAYVRATIEHGLAHQIRALRTARGWSQADLAAKIGAKNQSAISRLEDPSYGRHSLMTIEKLADAFDVALLVKFAPFSRLLDETEDLSPAALNAISFAEECTAMLAKEVNASEIAEDVISGVMLGISADKYESFLFAAPLFNENQYEEHHDIS